MAVHKVYRSDCKIDKVSSSKGYKGRKRFHKDYNLLEDTWLMGSKADTGVCKDCNCGSNMVNEPKSKYGKRSIELVSLDEES